MRVKMLRTAADPDRILDAGKHYNIPEGGEYIAAGHATEPDDGAQMVRVPIQPDPEETRGEQDDD